MSSLQMQKIRVAIAAEIHTEIFEGLYWAAVDQGKLLATQLGERAKTIQNDAELSESEKAFEIETLGDDRYISELTTDLAAEMTIVAFFKTIEISTKNMLKFSGLFTEAEVRSLFRFSELKRLLASKAIHIEQLSGFAEYDELRRVNNCVKHSGTVEEELAELSNWNEGDRLKDLQKTYIRLRDGAISFVTSLRDEVLSAIT